MLSTAQKLLYGLLISILIFISGTIHADDIEIYFSADASQGNTMVQPNILFIFDTSGSLAQSIGNQSRIAILKEAMRTILNDIQGVNLGLMRFTSNQGGPILYPIKPVNEYTYNIVSEENDKTNPTFVYTITDDKNDGQQDNGANLDTRTGSITIGSSKSAVFRFTDIDIPNGVTITNARLIFKADGKTTGDAAWAISLEDSSDSAELTREDIHQRPTILPALSVSTLDNTIPKPLADGTSFMTPNLNQQVQQVINHSGWCSGNAMTFIIKANNASEDKSIRSFINNNPPILRIAYSRDANTTGCSIGDVSTQIASHTDNVENTDTNGDTLNFEKDKVVGLRFTNIDIPKQATITDAYIRFNADQDSGTQAPTITINGEAADDSQTYGDVTSRTKTASSVTWQPSSWTKDEQYDTPNLKDIVQAIITRSGWESGKPIAFILSGTGITQHSATSYNKNASRAPRLFISYKTTTVPFKTVRQRLAELTNTFTIGDQTPLVGVLYEAARYWRGEGIKYGKTRDNNKDARISHPASYCSIDNNSLNCRGANTANPYGIKEPNNCPTDNLSAKACKNRAIEGNPSYISPIVSSGCGKNYQVLLTDGSAEAGNISLQSEIQSQYGQFGLGQCQTKNSSGDVLTNDEKCGIDIAKFMHTVDQHQIPGKDDGEQTVTTHTIGFDTKSLAGATQFLKDVAAAGGGEFYEASSVSDIVNVFENILTDVQDAPAALAAPSLTVNAFNRLLSRDELYYGLFKPELRRSWYGNVKKYKICTSASCTMGDTLDQNDKPAIDKNTGTFKSTAKSYWSKTVDGATITAGGAGAEFSDFKDRIIYTDARATGTAPRLGARLHNDITYKITHKTWDSPSPNLKAVRKAVCGTVDTNAECEARMLWMLGKPTSTQTTDVNSNSRWNINDILHSGITVITYGKNQTGFFDKLIFGVNDGSLRFLDAKTGKEEWSFIPHSMLKKQQSIYADAPGGDKNHIYGMDLTPVLNIQDKNNDGEIDPAQGDFVHAIAGMRRGGQFIYALNVTGNKKIINTSTKVKPRFLWRIQGGVDNSDFKHLAYTWSKPVLGTISTKTGAKKVMIFGGGYDTYLDENFGYKTTPSSEDNKGNMIFIVDPSNGKLIFSIGGAKTNANIKVTDMHYAIPSRVTLLDSDGDGIDDRIYVGDTGGQIWRVDLGHDINPSSKSPGSTVVGRLAAISTMGTPSEERRFFEPPSVVQVKDKTYASQSKYDYIIIGSGNRAHPLDKVTQDRLYAFRDYITGKMADTDNDNIADKYPSTGQPISGNNDLINVTNAILTANNAVVQGSSGWFYDFTKTGEKVLSAPITISDAVLFTTYAPDNVSSLCSARSGSGYAYNINVITANAALDWDADKVKKINDRKQALSSGIPSDIVPMFTKEGILGIVGTGGGIKKLGELAELSRFKTYWYEEKKSK